MVLDEPNSHQRMKEWRKGTCMATTLLFTQAQNQRTFFSGEARVSQLGNRILLVTLGQDSEVPDEYLERFVAAVKKEAANSTVKVVIDPTVDKAVVDNILTALKLTKVVTFAKSQDAKAVKKTKLW